MRPAEYLPATHRWKNRFCALGLTVWLLACWPVAAAAGPAHALSAAAALIGPRDAILVLTPAGHRLLSKNADQGLVPASTLKLLTALAALHYLGDDFRFRTEFYIDRRQNLKVKGYGDPLLISETLDTAAARLAGRLKKKSVRMADMVLDDSYFAQPLNIPGRGNSFQPYDAPNGALCANFNTVSFKRDAGGKLISAEPQTPLVPPAPARIRASHLAQGRIPLATRKDALLYVGNLLCYFLGAHGLPCNSRIRSGRVDLRRDQLIYRHMTPERLGQVVARLLRYSNNFIANQLLVHCGIALSGPPGTLAKGVNAVSAFARGLGVRGLRLVEGSGISRKNRISARGLMKVLTAFAPYRHLMRHAAGDWYKTGTLRGIHTRVGFLESGGREFYRYVVLVNTPGRSAAPVMDILHRALCGRGHRPG